MNQDDLVPTLGALACLLVLALVAVPYLVAAPGAVQVYYAVGPVSPLFVGLLAVVAGVALLAGAQRRSDPATTAGVGLALGVFMTAVALLWAVSVPADVLGGLSTTAAMAYHRWLLVLASLTELVLAAWYVRLVL